MSFEDLPDDLSERPLTEPRLVADVLDLVVSEADRDRGALAVLICDGQARLVQPVVVDLEDADPVDACARMLELCADAMGDTGSVMVAVARRDGLSIRAADRALARVARAACGERVRLLGVHVVTMAGSREVCASPAA